jgi:citrate synthase
VLRAAGGPDTAEKWTLDALARKERIMGFGHRVYKSGDVRAGIIKPYVRKAAEATDNLAWEDTADIIERVMEREKGMYPNVDWPAGRMYHAMHLEIPIYTPMFAMARVSGWSAHIIEQLDNNRLIRPRGLYKGPGKREVMPIAERG